MPQVVGQVLEVPKISSQDRVLHGTVEQIPDVLVPEMVEQLVKLPKTESDDRTQQRTAEHTAVIPVPQDVDELVEVFRVPQDRSQQRFAEQTGETLDISLAEKIVEGPVTQTQGQTQQVVRTHDQHVVNAVDAEVPLLQFTDKVADIPVVAQRQISLETLQKSIEIPQLRYCDEVIVVLAVSVVQVPQVHFVKKTVEDPQFEIVEKTIENPETVTDACLTCDAKCKVACETCVKDNMFMVAGEITVAGKTNHETIVRGVVPNIGFESLIDDLSSVDSKGLNYQDCEILFRVNKQSTNIADSVHVEKDDLDNDAHLRHARDETENAEFLTGSMATRLHVPVVTRRTTAAAQHRSTQQQHWHSNQQYNYHRKQWQQAGQTEEEGKEE